MATEKVVTVRSKYCDFLERDVELREWRVYPSADFLQTQVLTYQVRRCACTGAIDCNMKGITCRWAFTNPSNDRS
ncbi:MAG: hypothetical protein M9896_13275 [Candidatus Promineofilum sp.]|uniref:hypothetical protein n=1 Tax=Promineifilum sp. TaxID=2664178 RepID=UPI002411E61A|nr:hypothetical protein [Promineifilum sp.]